eukprot:SAG11_NODE_2465_length_3324_cov_2.765964_1_plen_75_part_00
MNRRSKATLEKQASFKEEEGAFPSLARVPLGDAKQTSGEGKNRWTGASHKKLFEDSVDTTANQAGQAQLEGVHA